MIYWFVTLLFPNLKIGIILLVICSTICTVVLFLLYSILQDNFEYLDHLLIIDHIPFKYDTDKYKNYYQAIILLSGQHEVVHNLCSESLRQFANCDILEKTDKIIKAHVNRNKSKGYNGEIVAIIFKDVQNNTVEIEIKSNSITFCSYDMGFNAMNVYKIYKQLIKHFSILNDSPFN